MYDSNSNNFYKGEEERIWFKLNHGQNTMLVLVNKRQSTRLSGAVNQVG